MSLLQVSLGERSYPIFIGAGESKKASNFERYVLSSQILIVSNETVAPLYLNAVTELLLGLGRHVDSVILPDGEAYKTLTVLNSIFDALLEKGHNRNTTIIALGGGVVGDMAGFAASAYQRGVGFIQIPTTLLAQVDSSVGGKTGVNHSLGKNMIGAFHQPSAVVIDTDMLSSLPARELSAGLAEVIKYGLIADTAFFQWLEDNIEKLLARENDALIYAIQTSCQIKADIVSQDEKESGIRAILNLGHTFGHAIEASEGYGVWLHGEAVGAGMVMACRMSFKLGWIDEGTVTRATELIKKAGLPVVAPADMTPEVFKKYMSVDKKVLDKSLRLVLLRECGKACITSDFSDEVLLETLRGV